MAGIVANHRYQMNFLNSHLTRNIFNLYRRRFFFGLVYTLKMTAVVVILKLYFKITFGTACGIRLTL